MGNQYNRSHGMFRTAEYHAWEAMKARCLNPRHPSYKDYGARGITICEAWLKFEAFFADMGKRPPGLTLERRQNDKGYEPGNCYWATRKEQQRNTRWNRLFIANGITHPGSFWAERLGTPYATIQSRLRQGWSDEDAVTIPVKHRV